MLAIIVVLVVIAILALGGEPPFIMRESSTDRIFPALSQWGSVSDWETRSTELSRARRRPPRPREYLDGFSSIPPPAKTTKKIAIYLVCKFGGDHCSCDNHGRCMDANVGHGLGDLHWRSSDNGLGSRYVWYLTDKRRIAH